MRLLLTFLLLLTSQAMAAQRFLKIKTTDGRVISGVLVLETDRSLLIRTEQGNVNVTWAEIESSADESAVTPALSPQQTSAPKSKTRLGLSAGLGVGPSGRPTSYERVWLAGDLSAFLDVDLGLLGVRVAFDLQPGARAIGAYSRPMFQLYAGIDTQLRLHFSDRIGSGMGLTVGIGAAAESFGGIGAAFAFGPSLTLLAVRFGENLHHELSAGGSMLFSPGSTTVAFTGGLAVLRYAWLF